MQKSRQFILTADAWYACDIFGERVTGPALLSDFDQTIALLSPWRYDDSHWIRRVVGVAAHFWAKRTRGEEAHQQQAGILLDFLGPMFEERAIQAAKGVGWGYKTIGRYYPKTACEWLTHALSVEKRRPMAVVKRKVNGER